MTEWITCKFFRTNWPFGKKSKPVKRTYYRRKKVKGFRLQKILLKKTEDTKE